MERLITLLGGWSASTKAALTTPAMDGPSGVAVAGGVLRPGTCLAKDLVRPDSTPGLRREGGEWGKTEGVVVGGTGGEASDSCCKKEKEGKILERVERKCKKLLIKLQPSFRQLVIG